MTELEKKAEEEFERVFNKVEPSYISVFENDPPFEKNKTYYEEKYLKKWWLDGYEQGIGEECCLCHYYANSEKLEKENETLKWEQKQILEDNEYWQEQFTKADKERAELEKAVTEFSSVIEKMKCCENCKHNQNKLEDNEVCWNCERQCSKLGEEVIKDEWELAE